MGIEVASFWHGGELPRQCRLCLKSFIDHGHAFTLYSYDDMAVPAGVRLADAAEILPRSSVFLYRHGPGAGSVAGFTNLLRYKLLAERGGWWVDADVVCLTARPSEADIVFGYESDDMLGSAIIKLPRGHALATELYARASEIVAARGDALAWGEVGPGLLCRVAEEKGLMGHASPARLFYPTEWTEAQLVMQPDAHATMEERTRGSQFLHLWNEVFRRENLDGAAPPPGSFLATLYARHGV